MNHEVHIVGYSRFINCQGVKIKPDREGELNDARVRPTNA